MQTNPYPARNQKITGQSPSLSSQPPMIGAIAGASPKIICTWPIARCAAGPVSRSGITARATMVPPPAQRPWITRKTSSTGRFGASAQPTEARVKIAVEAMITGRRPSASDSGPWNRLITANASM